MIERLPGESERAFAVFQIFMSLDIPNVKQAYQIFSKGKGRSTHIYNWCAKYRWYERRAQYLMRQAGMREPIQ
jgi:hypothetical protein